MKERDDSHMRYIPGNFPILAWEGLFRTEVSNYPRISGICVDLGDVEEVGH